jgi:hypothetical protein
MQGECQQAAEKLFSLIECSSAAKSCWLILRHLRRGSKPHPFQTGPEAEFFSSLLGQWSGNPNLAIP